MIEPFQQAWWLEILHDENGDYRDPGYDLIELMSNEHNIPLFSARRICVGAKNEGILREDSWHGDLEFLGVSQLNPNETPDWVEQARDIRDNGVTTFGYNDILLYDSELLLRKASQNMDSSNQDIFFRVSCDVLLEYIQRKTVLGRSEIDQILEKEKEEGSGLDYNDGKFTNEIKGVSKISEWK